MGDLAVAGTGDWGVLSREARARAYDNAAASPDSAERLAAWREASAALRAARPAHLDLPYGPGERQRWDLFPAADPGAPCLAFVHGGYWQRNSREGFATMAEGVLARGWSAALMGYTLAPAASLTAIVAELRAALDWLEANRAARGIAGPVVLAGWSAGGHLAAMGFDHPVVAAGLAVSGVFELGPLRDTPNGPVLGLTDAEVASLSPLRLAPVNKPLVIAYGGAELPAFVGDGRALHARRADAGCPGPLIALPGRRHFDVLEELRAPDGELTRALVALAEPLVATAASPAIDDPAVLAEVRAAFAAYEAALTGNDVAVLDALFRDAPETVRYGATEVLHGHGAIRAFRAGRAGAGLARRLLGTRITTYGRDAASASTLFRRDGAPGKLGRQTQTWLRFPEGWRVVAAHVSLIDDPDGALGAPFEDGAEGAP